MTGNIAKPMFYQGDFREGQGIYLVTNQSEIHKYTVQSIRLENGDWVADLVYLRKRNQKTAPRIAETNVPVACLFANRHNAILCVKIMVAENYERVRKESIDSLDKDIIQSMENLTKNQEDTKTEDTFVDTLAVFSKAHALHNRFPVTSDDLHQLLEKPLHPDDMKRVTHIVDLATRQTEKPEFPYLPQMFPGGDIMAFFAAMMSAKHAQSSLWKDIEKRKNVPVSGSSRLDASAVGIPRDGNLVSGGPSLAGTDSIRFTYPGKG